MDKEFYKEIFLMPFPQNFMTLLVGAALLVLPDFSAAFGIALRNRVENSILFLGAMLSLLGFLGFMENPVRDFLQGFLKGHAAAKAAGNPPKPEP